MSKLKEMEQKFPQTELWMDSFHVEHHAYGLSQGITGVTTSPTWVSRMMLNEEGQEEVIKTIQKSHPEYNEQEMMWAWTLEMGKQRSQIMLPIWEQGDPKKGRFSIQTSIYDYNNKEKMVEMAKQVHACGKNMQVKIPSTPAGIAAMEEATYLGISVMATVCFSVDQAIAVAKALEAGMKRREAEGKDISTLNPVCAVLLGMQDDYCKQYAENHNIVVHPDAYSWPGVAVAKKVYGIYKERGYRTKMLVAYYRHQLHWSQFIGGDVLMTIPYKWQKRFEDCAVEIKDYMSIPVDDFKIKELNKLEPFQKAYTEGSYTVDEFLSIPTVIETIHYFTQEYEKAVHKVRNIMLEREL